MESHAHLLHQTWHQLRFLPISPLARLSPEGDGPVLDGLLARAGVFRQRTPALRDLDRLPQLRAYLALPGRGPTSRFCDGSFRMLYAGESVATCVAEMAHHHGHALAETGEPAGAIRVFEALAWKVSGSFLDARRGHGNLHKPDGYALSQHFGRDLKVAGEAGLAYRAVRRKGGECLGLLLPLPVKACSLKAVLTLQWDGARLG